jgi:hypothetical protein
MIKPLKHSAIEEKISIKAELEIPLGELAIYLLKPGEDAFDVVSLLEIKQEFADAEMTKLVRNILFKKTKRVNLVSLNLDYCDSGNISHGAAIFCSRLIGTEIELRKVAGEDKLFAFDWKDGSHSVITKSNSENS